MNVYLDRYDWINELMGGNFRLTNVNFNDAISNGKNPITSGGITIKDNIGMLSITKTNGSGLASNGNMVDFTHNQPVNVSLPRNVHAIGFDLVDSGHLHPQQPKITNVSFSTGDFFDIITGSNIAPIFSFFGFISDVPISTLSFKPSVITEAYMDNFSYAQSPRHGHHQ